MIKGFQELKDRLTDHADEADAKAMQSYMKDHFKFYGIKSPLRKELQKSFIKEWCTMEPNEVKSLILLMWDQDEREWQYIAMDTLKRYLPKMNETFLPFIEDLIRHKSWWDTVDFLASTCMGKLLQRFPDRREQWIEKWIESQYLWLERTAIIHQLKYGSQTDAALLEALIEIKKEDQQFFIQKAIGWSLRQYSKYNPLAVKEILSNHPELSGLAVREASKYLSSAGR